MKTQFDTLKNVRINRQADAWLVTGMPQQVATIPEGHRLVMVEAERYFTISANTLYCDGNAIATLAGSLVNMHRVGAMLVAVTTQGLTFLAESGTGFEPVSPSEALPEITVTQQAAATISAALPPIAFAEPYDTWRAPLQQADVTAVTTALRTAWNVVSSQAEAQRQYYGPVQVRYGVRLWDDSYLWVSEPVTLGEALLANAPNINVDVDVEGSRLTGIPSATVSISTFTLGVTVHSGVATQWRNMVKAVDILATTQVSPVQSTASIFYRCLTTSGGERRPVLNFGFTAQNVAQAAAQMAHSQWTVVASCTNLDALAQGQWITVDVPDDITLTAEQCASVTLPAERPLVASLVCNGRLYLADADGLMTTSRPANALVVERSCLVTGAGLLGLAPVPRSLYSGGFGRYPVYLFTTEGIFAIPLTMQGKYGEPRLLDRTILKADCQPVEGDRDIYFTSARGNLCRLRASTVIVIEPAAHVAHMAWDDVHSELWCLDAEGKMSAIVNGEITIKRSVGATHLYDDLTHALAINASGQVLDLTIECQAMMEVELLTRPEVCRRQPRQVMWQVYGDDVHLRLDVLGERGVSCHGFLVNRMTVNGRIAAPLIVPLFAQPLRTIRRHIIGTADTGTIIAEN